MVEHRHGLDQLLRLLFRLAYELESLPARDCFLALCLTFAHIFVKLFFLEQLLGRRVSKRFRRPN